MSRPALPVHTVALSAIDEVEGAINDVMDMSSLLGDLAVQAREAQAPVSTQGLAVLFRLQQQRCQQALASLAAGRCVQGRESR
jgi:hypothetical protein